MDETLRFIIGVAVFLAVITFEWFKVRASKRTF
jgi:hypothetical protein